MLKIGLLCSLLLIGIRGDARADDTPVIIFVHGRAQMFKLSSLLREEWFAAFRDGVAKVDRTVGSAITLVPLAEPAATLPESLLNSLQFVNYEFIFEPDFLPVAEECRDGAIVQRSLSDSVRRAVRKWLHDAARRKGRLAGAITKLGVKYFLEDTENYLYNPSTRCETDTQMLKAFREAGTRPIVLVTHSMGAMVAYDALMSGRLGDRKPNIVRWVTVGAQLASREVVRALMYDPNATLTRPETVKNWVNIFDIDDFVGLEIIDAISGLRNYAVETDPDRAHWIGGYLKNRHTAAAILRGWCEGFAIENWPPGDAPTPPPFCAAAFDVDRPP